LARQSFVLILDQITVALSHSATLDRVGFEFISDFFALPALGELPAPCAETIHGTSPEI